MGDRYIDLITIGYEYLGQVMSTLVIFRQPKTAESLVESSSLGGPVDFPDLLCRVRPIRVVIEWAA